LTGRRLFPTIQLEKSNQGRFLSHLTDDARPRNQELMTDAYVYWETVARFVNPVEQRMMAMIVAAESPVGKASAGKTARPSVPVWSRGKRVENSR
jgi:hypothetical protein